MLIGLVGKPSVGKSTFFKACTLSDVAIAAYPFTTIKPNHGVGYVKIPCIDKEFNVQCQPRTGYCKNGIRFVPVDLVDVAGLVKDAHKGKGRGNEFMNDLREADLLIQILDASGKTDEGGNPTEGYDVTEEVEFLRDEIDMWVYGILERSWNSLVRKSKSTKLSLELFNQLSGLKINEDDIKAIMKKLELSEKGEDWKESHVLEFAREIRKKSKPIIIAANKIDLPGAEENLKILKDNYPETFIVPCSADSELALREASNHGLIDYIPGDKEFKVKGNLNELQKKALNAIKANVLDKFGSTGVQEVLNSATFNFLKYIAVFPAGVNKLADSKGRVLPDCFLVPPGTTALDFAFKLHTDLGKNFIKAIDVRTKKAVGKEYILKNRDGIEIITR
jgi:ribosome-binding ATPase